MTTGLALESRKDAREKTSVTDDGQRSEPVRSGTRVGVNGTRSGWPMRGVYLCSDLLSISLSILTAIGIGSLLFRVSWQALGVIELKIFGILGAALVAVAAVQRSYASIPPRPVRQFHGWMLGAGVACAIEMSSLWLFGVGTTFHLAVLFGATLLAGITAAFNRAMCRMLFGKRAWWGTRLIVVGCDGLASDVMDDLEREPQWGLRPVGFVDDSFHKLSEELPRRFLGPLDALDALSREFGCNRALAAVDSFNAQEVADLMCRAGGGIQHWVILPPLDKFPCMWLHVAEAARRPAFSVTNRLSLPSSYALKRGFDLAVTLSLGMLLFPLLILLAMLTRLTSRGPVFYGQQRIGRHGQRFRAWKFRTMVPNADEVLHDYLTQHPELAAEWEATHKLKQDPRVTVVGRWLRMLSLDELPQIWNVIVGDMSLVGPRPIVAAEVEKYADRYRQYAQVLPGVTGMWQVSGRNNTTYEERVELDVYYVENWSLCLDVYILACTVKVVLLGEGAY